jgi:hypothetical protein
MMQEMDFPKTGTIVRRVVASGALTLAFAAATGAQTDISKLGPQVGGRAVDFQLVDQFGHPQSLESVAGPRGTMLVFFRSADW